MLKTSLDQMKQQIKSKDNEISSLVEQMDHNIVTLEDYSTTLDQLVRTVAGVLSLFSCFSTFLLGFTLMWALKGTKCKQLHEHNRKLEEENKHLQTECSKLNSELQVFQPSFQSTPHISSPGEQEPLSPSLRHSAGQVLQKPTNTARAKPPSNASTGYDHNPPRSVSSSLLLDKKVSSREIIKLLFRQIMERDSYFSQIINTLKELQKHFAGGFKDKSGTKGDGLVPPLSVFSLTSPFVFLPETGVEPIKITKKELDKFASDLLTWKVNTEEAFAVSISLIFTLTHTLETTVTMSRSYG